MKFREKLMGPSADRSVLGFRPNPGGPLGWVLELLGGDAVCRPIPTRMALYGGGRRECPREPATRGDMSQTGSEQLPTFNQTHSWRHPQALVSVARGVRAQTGGQGGTAGSESGSSANGRRVTKPRAELMTGGRYEFGERRSRPQDVVSFGSFPVW